MVIIGFVKIWLSVFVIGKFLVLVMFDIWDCKSVNVLLIGV